MAELRDSPFIWVSWLTKIMTGETTCQWQGWFKSKNKLTEEQPNDFNLVGWTIDHTKLLTELQRELIKAGYNPVVEQPIKHKILDTDMVVSGKIDCIVEKEDEVVVYDCKTGKERSSDQAQVMIYIYFLSKNEVYKKPIKGIVMYKDKKVEISNLPENFEENFNFFVEVLSSTDSPPKNAGESCRFCSITKTDCPERID